MNELNINITCLFLEENNNFKRLPIGTFHLLHNYITTKHNLHETSFSIPVDTIRGRANNGTTGLKPGPLAVAYQIETIILRYIWIKQECVKPITKNDIIYCSNSLITESNVVTVVNLFQQYSQNTQQEHFF